MIKVEVPSSALVHCPKVDYKLARVVACVGCEHFEGLEDRFPDSDVKLYLRFGVKCRHTAITREMKELAE